MEDRIKRTKSAGGVIVNQKGKIVLVLPAGHKSGWFFPKGTIEKGEAVLGAAIREVGEEAGITDLKLVKKLGNYQRHPVNNDSEMKTITMFLFSSREKKPISRDLSEISKVRWMAKERVAELLFHPKDKEFFLKIIRKIS